MLGYRVLFKWTLCRFQSILLGWGIESWTPKGDDVNQLPTNIDSWQMVIHILLEYVLELQKKFLTLSPNVNFCCSNFFLCFEYIFFKTKNLGHFSMLLFFFWLCQFLLQHTGSSSLMRDQTLVPCIESIESSPRDHREGPYATYF